MEKNCYSKRTISLSMAVSLSPSPSLCRTEGSVSSRLSQTNKMEHHSHSAVRFEREGSRFKAMPADDSECLLFRNNAGFVGPQDHVTEEERLKREEAKGVDGEDGNGGDVDDEGSTKLDEGFYEVEAIRKKRVRKGEVQYLIKCLQTRKQQKGKRKIGTTPHTQPKKKQQKRSTNTLCNDTTGKTSKKQCTSPRFSNQTKSQNKFKAVQVPFADVSSDKFPKNFRKAKAPEVNGVTNVDCGVPVLRLVKGSRSTGAEMGATLHAPVPISTRYADRIDEFVVRIDRVGESSGHKNKIDEVKKAVHITKILRPIGYSETKLNNVRDMSVTFMAMRSDGTQVLVDNKFLKANYPLLLINFYEKYLRYCPEK